MLQARDIHAYYGRSHVVQGVSLDVRAGEVVALVGRNGVGKSTMVRCINGLLPIARGSVKLDGIELARLSTRATSLMGVAVVLQGHRVFASLSVERNLAIAERIGTDARWTRRRVYEFFPRLAERHSQRAGTMSGGEQKMLAIAQALLMNPRVLVLDEPTEGLAPLLVERLMQLISEVRGEGTAVLLVEQDLRFALALANRVYAMSKGTVVFEGRPSDLQTNAEVRALYLGI
jgi:branched-chain amino acid transport system ATP-binding protein